MKYFLVVKLSKNLENLLSKEKECFGGWWSIGEVEFPQVHGDILHDHVDFVFDFVVSVIFNNIRMIKFLDDVQLPLFSLGCFTSIDFLDGCYNSCFDVDGFPHFPTLQKMSSFPILKTLLNITKIFFNNSLIFQS